MLLAVGGDGQLPFDDVPHLLLGVVVVLVDGDCVRVDLVYANVMWSEWKKRPFQPASGCLNHIDEGHYLRVLRVIRRRRHVISLPQAPTTPQGATYLLPHVTPDGNVWTTLTTTLPGMKFSVDTIALDRSTDSGQTWTNVSVVASNIAAVPGQFDNTTFRDGIVIVSPGDT